MNTECYFAGDHMTGNKECNVYKSIRENNFTITNCFTNHPEVRQKMNDLWGILNNVDSYLSLRDHTAEEVKFWGKTV